MSSPKIKWEEMAHVIAGEGPFLAAAGDISDLREHFNFKPGVPVEKLTHAISLAFPLSEPVLEGCGEGPTILYKHHYRQVNMLLDRAALAVHGFIRGRGGVALPVPASVFTDWKTQAAHLSHKMIALRTGIGWIGRHILMTTHEYGARVRLVSILTDLPVESPPRPAYECGECRKCIDVCPVSAIKEAPDDFDLEACSGQVREFEKHNLGVRICGICIKMCKPGLGRPVKGG